MRFLPALNQILQYGIVNILIHAFFRGSGLWFVGFGAFVLVFGAPYPFVVPVRISNDGIFGHVTCTRSNESLNVGLCDGPPGLVVAITPLARAILHPRPPAFGSALKKDLPT